MSDTLTRPRTHAPRTHAPLQVIVHFSEGEAKALAVLAGALGSDEARSPLARALARVRKEMNIAKSRHRNMTKHARPPV
ncbi:hypothetical protein AB4Z40_35140 [Bosea sp. 2YAB26]|uniref:hypothetical protein n=1 Tax=Bosea sp. 2YAB26 TaxID=3237478 RepID=UPI003F906582